MLETVSGVLLAVVASAYALSLPFAGWLVWEAGRVRREADAAHRLLPQFEKGFRPG